MVHYNMALFFDHALAATVAMELLCSTVEAGRETSDGRLPSFNLAACSLVVVVAGLQEQATSILLLPVGSFSSYGSYLATVYAGV